MDFDKLKKDFEFRLERYDAGNCDWKYLPEYLIQAVKEEYLSFPVELPVLLPERNSFGQWIEAKEFSMPDFGQRVLIITKDGNYDVCRYEKEYIDGYTNHSFRNSNNIEKVAFKWMPLPRP